MRIFSGTQEPGQRQLEGVCKEESAEIHCVRTRTEGLRSEDTLSSERASKRATRCSTLSTASRAANTAESCSEMAPRPARQAQVDRERLRRKTCVITPTSTHSHARSHRALTQSVCSFREPALTPPPSRSSNARSSAAAVPPGHTRVLAWRRAQSIQQSMPSVRYLLR